MELLFKLLKSPITWLVIASVALTMFVAGLMISNNNLSHKNDELKAKAAYAEEVVKIQKQSIDILKKDIALQDELQKAKQQVTVKQSTINQKLNAIPKTSKDRPFSDNNLFSAANELRAYQQDAYPDSAPNNNN